MILKPHYFFGPQIYSGNDFLEEFMRHFKNRRHVFSVVFQWEGETKNIQAGSSLIRSRVERALVDV